ncbi:MAG: TAXI family TRAP transporter solute-binding subunit [Alphaproteobacteria bacterium]|nr:TAXI family TRAP transporter solute-binding subunit [Alphaproteobacteria bacterium]
MAGLDKTRGTRPTGWSLFILATLVASFAVASAQDIKFFRLGTGPSNGTSYPIGEMIAGAISNPPGSRECEKGGSCGVPGMIAVAQSTAGSVGNVEAIGKSGLDGAIVQADVAFWAYYGAGIYTPGGAIRDLRAVANLYRDSIHLVARSGVGVASVADLKGKRVAMGEPGSGTLVDAQLIIKAFGLKEADMRPAYIKTEQAIDQMIEGRLDALFLVGMAPSREIAELAERLPIEVIPIAGAELDELRKTTPFFVETAIPGGLYKGADKPTPTLGIGALLVVSSRLSGDTVYGITRALWHKNTRAALDSGHPLGKRIQLESALQGVPIPLHPGAEKYYREAKMMD